MSLIFSARISQKATSRPAKKKILRGLDGELSWAINPSFEKSLHLQPQLRSKLSDLLRLPKQRRFLGLRSETGMTW